MRKEPCVVCGKMVNVKELGDTRWCNECTDEGTSRQMAIDSRLGALVKNYVPPPRIDSGDVYLKALAWLLLLGLLILVSGLASVVVTIVLRRWIMSVILLSTTVVLLAGLWLLWRWQKPYLEQMSKIDKMRDRELNRFARGGKSGLFRNWPWY